MRMIFSTVRSPHDPALTVESSAMIATGRPCTRTTPVTTPSAGRSPPAALLWWYLGAPPFLIFSASAASSSGRPEVDDIQCTLTFLWSLSFELRAALLGEGR